MKSDSQKLGSEYVMSAGDNAASRKQINASIISKATANEQSFRDASMAGLQDISGNKKFAKDTSLPPKSAEK